MDALRQLATENSQLQYIPSILNGVEEDGCALGTIDNVIFGRIPVLSGWRGFICGDPGIVQILRKKLFLSGMASRDIFADAFLPAAPR